MVNVTATVDNQTTELENTSENAYQVNLTAPTPKMDTAVYSVEVTATGDNGAETTETAELIVEGDGIFPLKMIAAKATGEEIDYIQESIEADFDICDTNDFELRMSQSDWNKEKFYYGNRIFIPQTEYGGIIEEIEPMTGSSEIALRGPAWRGMLLRKIVKPPEGESHLILSGELNIVIRELIGERFGALFVIPEVDTGVIVTNHQVDRYVTLYDAIIKLLNVYNYRLQIAYFEPEGLEYGYVTLQAVPVVDYSEELEYSQDSNVNFNIRDYRGGINHLICIGEGQNEERIVLDLYVQEDGTIGRTPFYTGLAEREAVYEYSSADEVELENGGIERLKELMNYKSVNVTVDDIDLEIGDIIGGYEQITETSVVKPVIGKILRIQDGKATIEYKIKGDD